MSSVEKTTYDCDDLLGDECEWIKEQESRRNTVENACAHYPHENITNDVLRHILVSDAHNLLYCYIPKVACTNWKGVILTLNGKYDYPSVHRTYIPSLENFSPEEREKRLQNYTKIMIVRNPHERALSAYNEKYVSDTDNNFMDDHWREMYRICSPCAIKYNFIGKLETINKDSTYILSHIGATNLTSRVSTYILSHIGATNLTSIVQTKAHHATNSSMASRVQKAYEQVTEEDVLQFEKRFEQDMVLFGYERPTSITGFKSEDEDRMDALNQISQSAGVHENKTLE
ncbi:carbohydrate sulfotransferase 14-like [Amphiura filiformis]|uniref:carbohydrate sulfotransferase 14-like n=1 Tax=Amphiura filiformis TaxID=82378 RepID=UPI003B210204